MGEHGFNYSGGFALIVVLFILLIIVGAAWL
ncbi:YjcZ family sporulation protein [Metabacillus sp. B2-18]|nr:YjcZ family sporulation protein [Metabacillus sp. B2-18]UGB29333.1 YjcZ family sporulation protein [Metabacillus sp. B2-18]